MGSGEAAAIALAMEQRAQLVAIDDKNGINACKLVKLAFTTAIAMLVEGAAKGWLDREQALARLEILASHARYKQSILEDARRRLGVLK